MSTTTGTTRWLGESVIPQSYEDVAALVKLARKARFRRVEFDWAFSRDDLLCLRRAVYEWGCAIRGSYRCFDARLLRAINQALGDTSTVFVLDEPRNLQSLDYTVTCTFDDNVFHVRGQASFDIVFGYGGAGLQESGPGRQFLTASIRDTLVSSVSNLKWDLQRLQEARFAPVRSVMFGLRPGYITADDVPLHPGPALDVPVHFQGPFSAIDDQGCPCLFTDLVAKQTGIYLWTIRVNGEDRVWYVGQTRRAFGQRMAEHVANMLSGQYATHDPAALSQGDSARLSKNAIAPSWPVSLPVYLANWDTVAADVIAVIRLLRFHVAPLTSDRHLYDRVEGAIGRYYKTHPEPELKSFIGPGLAVPAFIPGDQPMRLLLRSEASIAGLPQEILEPAEFFAQGVPAGRTP